MKKYIIITGSKELLQSISVAAVHFVLPAWLADLADKDGASCTELFQNALIEYPGVYQ